MKTSYGSIYLAVIFAAFGNINPISAQHRLLPGEQTPEEVVRNIVRVYEKIGKSPYLKLGKIDQFFAMPEFKGMSKEDKKVFTSSIVSGEFPSKVNYKAEGGTIIIDDLSVADGKVVLDFKEFAYSEHGKIYINQIPYELKFLVPGEKDGSWSVSKQLDDLEYFWARRTLQSYLPGLSDSSAAWAYTGIQVLFSPLAILTGCSKKKARSSAMRLGAAAHAARGEEGVRPSPATRGTQPVHASEP